MEGYVLLTRDMLNNVKISRIRRTERGNDKVLFWLFLLMLAQGHNGKLEIEEGIPLTAEDIAAETGFNLKDTTAILNMFTLLKLVKLENNAYSIENWETYLCQHTAQSKNNTYKAANTEKISVHIKTAISEWNKLSKFGVNSVTKIDTESRRYQYLDKRIKQYGIENVLNAIKSIPSSDFLIGKNKNGWCITFDWFVKPNNFPKVLDGNYGNKIPKIEKVEAENETQEELVGDDW